MRMASAVEICKCKWPVCLVAAKTKDKIKMRESNLLQWESAASAIALASLPCEEGKGSISEDCKIESSKFHVDIINHENKNRNQAVSAAGSGGKQGK